MSNCDKLGYDASFNETTIPLEEITRAAWAAWTLSRQELIRFLDRSHGLEYLNNPKDNPGLTPTYLDGFKENCDKFYRAGNLLHFLLFANERDILKITRSGVVLDNEHK